MSKIFDSLRWAEAKRRKSSVGKKERTAPDSPGDQDFPGDMLRQLGIMRNSLEPIFVEKQQRSLLFTSAVSGEGTTTVSMNFARFLAMQSAGKTLLCEMNARHPSFSRMFSMNGQVGLTDFFETKSDLATIAHPLEDGLDVIQVGKQDPALIQLHLARVFPRLVEEAMSVYETVIFDAPSVLNYPETPPMTAFVDGVVMIVRAGKTKREVVQRSLETVTKANGRVLGVVLNRKKYYIPGFVYKRI
jgi:capsular exopolysaccharide synthesis family protein